eukprot:gene42614-56643_t
MASDLIKHVSDASFQADVLEAQAPVLVDFWAEWCGPCKMIAPILDEVAGSYDGKLKIAKLNVDDNRDVPAKFGIRGIPTLMLFKDGQLAATKVGAMSKAQLTAFIDQQLADPRQTPPFICAPSDNRTPAPPPPALHVSEVLKQAEALEIENTGRMRKQELMFAIIKKRAKGGELVYADGVLEVLPDGFGFLRAPDTSYTASTDDIYISPSQIRRFNLHTGDMIEGEVRIPKDGERYFALNKLDKINGLPPEDN